MLTIEGEVEGRTEVQEIQGAEAHAFFNSVCEHYLSISGNEFLRRWNQGIITPQDGELDSRVSRVISVLPFAA